MLLNTIDFVNIGNPNNPVASNGKGQVSYEYQISRYEITNSQYCAFLNNVAAITDPYELFSPLMQEHFFGGIVRDGVEGNYSYKCKVGYEELPIVGLTWMSAIRFVNWLHYNAANIENGVPINQYVKQTEGDSCNGAYDTMKVPVSRNTNALYWLPNEHEWLKAGFFNGTSWNEKLFLKGSNCYTSNGWAYPYPHVKRVGYGVAPSHYGTYDQQGNVAEWIENTRNDDWKLALGGSLIRPYSFAMFSESEGDFPTKSIATFGIRVCRTADEDMINNYKTEIYNPVVSFLQSPSLQKDNCGDEYVLVSDAGNTGDVVNQFKGRVNYNFLIARTELSNRSYCKFLNAVATIDDPYGLYDENMATGACGGIMRVKVDGEYFYHCKEGWDSRPVVYVNYYDITRYANWMHYGCPTGESGLGTTEGTSTYGAYDTSDYEEVRSGAKAPYENFGKRNIGARFWIPSDNEWYKAAYYNPDRIGNRKYYDYPTQSSLAPPTESANYMNNNEFSVGAPFFLAPVDSFKNAPSYYGTLQQGGNVWEWTEDWQYNQIGSRGLRGGSWSYTAYGLNAINVDPGGIDNSGYVFGARLCMSVSETGWTPVDTPIATKIYEYFLMLPKRYLLVALFGVLFITLLCFMISTIFVIRMFFRRK